MVQHSSHQFRTVGIHPFGFVVEKVVLGQALLRVLRFISPLGMILLISLLRVIGDRKKSAGTLQQYTLQHPMLLKLKKKGRSFVHIVLYCGNIVGIKEEIRSILRSEVIIFA
jgi:hypothetical protein